MSSALPFFHSDVPTAELVVIDHALLRDGDQEEINTLWEAATEQGFWYLKNHGAENLIEPMFEMGRKLMGLSQDEKMKFWQGSTGPAGSFGYKAIGAITVDLKGSKDHCEMFDISQDDIVSYPKITHVTYPSLINENMESSVKPFVSTFMEANSTILNVFNNKLGLPPGKLSELHSMDEFSLSEARIIKVPPVGDSDTVAVGSHTDFGSITFVTNTLPGLQVLLPGENNWKYVKPLPGHVICNIGDALNLLSGGILQSSMHRVLPPPKQQSRWSVVLLTRPGNSVPLKALSSESEIIAASPGKDLDSGATALQWFSRRHVKLRTSDRDTVVADFLASGGTEHTRMF